MDIPLTARDPRYGWIPDLPDERDFLYTSLVSAMPTLVKHVDLRANCTSVENQGELGSCTANALVGNLEFIEKKNEKEVTDFSRLFLYYNERVIRHTQKSDSGASIRDGIKTLSKTGICHELLWPYIIANFAEKPPDKAYAEAKKYEILQYYRLRSTAEMKHTLMTGFPFVFGFVVYESFESPQVAKTGVVPLPKTTERVVGGHAVMAVGYDDTKNEFLIRNSWGTSWGQNGYCVMPYDYFTSDKLASDFWTIRTME